MADPPRAPSPGNHPQSSHCASSQSVQTSAGNAPMAATPSTASACLPHSHKHCPTAQDHEHALPNKTQRTHPWPPRPARRLPGVGSAKSATRQQAAAQAPEQRHKIATMHAPTKLKSRTHGRHAQHGVRLAGRLGPLLLHLQQQQLHLELQVEHHLQRAAEMRGGHHEGWSCRLRRKDSLHLQRQMQMQVEHRLQCAAAGEGGHSRLQFRGNC